VTQLEWGEKQILNLSQVLSAEIKVHIFNEFARILKKPAESSLKSFISNNLQLISTSWNP